MLYVHHIVFSALPTVALQALQRLALVLLLAWMVAVAVTLLRVRSEP